MIANRGSLPINTLNHLVSRLKSSNHVYYQKPPPPPQEIASIDPAIYTHKIGIVVLPKPLQQALRIVVSEVGRFLIRQSSLRIFDSLRSTTGTRNSSNSVQKSIEEVSPHHFVYDSSTAHAYLASRMPSAYSTIFRALTETYSRLKSPPTSVLDIGTGPGTAVWALRAIESKLRVSDPAHVTAVDVNEHMLNLAKRMAKLTNLEDGIEWSDSLPLNLNKSFDLSIAGYVFGETDDASIRSRLLSSIWDLTKSTLVIVDRGTPQGYSRINEAREWLIQQKNSAILAPCPHMKQCPLIAQGSGWCHIAQRLERPRETQRAKDSEIDTEDVKFSYLVVQRTSSSVPIPSTWPRVISPPVISVGNVTADVCTPRGRTEQMRVTQVPGRKHIYRASRRLGWGDQWPYSYETHVPDQLESALGTFDPRLFPEWTEEQISVANDGLIQVPAPIVSKPRLLPKEQRAEKLRKAVKKQEDAKLLKRAAHLERISRSKSRKCP